jgi:hypothetical protein
MDDKERIEYIILEKQLSNTEFCAKANIAPATLSHILGGRSKPSLVILRGVVMGFPDLNPEWVLLGIGNMYRENGTPANIDTNDSSDSPISCNVTDEETFGSFGNMNDMFATPQNANIYNSKAQNLAQHKPATEKSEMSKQNISDIVRETLEQTQKPQRKIVEVRIFFDDGTYETFYSK